MGLGSFLSIVYTRTLRTERSDATNGATGIATRTERSDAESIPGSSKVRFLEDPTFEVVNLGVTRKHLKGGCW